jgi:hypothetical protein
MKTPYWLRLNWIKRKLTLKIARSFRTNAESNSVKRPRKMTRAEETATSIFISVLKDKGSKLYYDIHTQECYLRSEDASIYVFLESRNVKIINSVFGYDVHISGDLEAFLGEKFIREMSIRRKAFKEEALSKVNHSLDQTLDRMKTKLNYANN